MRKYIFVTGGVVSGIGKGLVAASIGRLLKSRGLKVFNQKFDPYLNVDPGTMSPYQHGEVFVTKDGGETDLDLGHYERFIDEELTKNASVTTGHIYTTVISKERRGDYLGATIQVIPHITDEIKGKIYKAAEESDADVVITEIGGTVGDIESLPFLEAIRQVHTEQDRDNVIFIHTTLVPKIPGSGELKSKPTQHSYKELMSLGIKPNIIVFRCEEPITDDIRQKISLFCDVNIKAVVESPNVDILYELPLKLHDQGLDDYILYKLNIEPKVDELSNWVSMIDMMKGIDKEIRVAIVGKYVQLHDAYLSVVESLNHAGYHCGCKVNIEWVNSEEIDEKNLIEKLSNVDGILVPGGFGGRGIEGKIMAAKFARENNVPYFGICLGMQIATIEFARNICGIKDANSTEWDTETTNPIIHLMPDQNNVTDMGGTLRLGNWECALVNETLAKKSYNQETILERHRHRYEFNNDYCELLSNKGMIVSGINPEKNLVEIIELENHPWYVGCQFHPEFKSRPDRPHPLFYGFIDSIMKIKNSD